MAAEHLGAERACGERVGLGEGVTQGGDGAGALAFQLCNGIGRCSEELGEQGDAAFALGGVAERAQGEVGAVVVDAATELGAQFGKGGGDGFFVERAGAGFQQRARERGKADLVRWVVGRTSSKADVDVDQRQRARLDEIHARAVVQRPVLDGWIGARRQGDEGQRGDEQRGEQGEGETQRHRCGPVSEQWLRCRPHRAVPAAGRRQRRARRRASAESARRGSGWRG